MSSEPGDPAGMVQWYNPRQLFRTGALVVVSDQFAHHADNRDIQALASRGYAHKSYEAPADGADFWFDYVADTGDGFNPTYAVASGLARDMPFHDGTAQGTLPRGRLLVLGGDLIYPTPTDEGYHQRLITPYQDAMPERPDQQPDVWAIPGNHDWYDSLVCFRRLFCIGRDFGHWKTQQRRSYFAVQLPQNWWLLAVDVQLLHDIDHAQLVYFQRILKRIGEHDRVILCCAEPFWLPSATRPEFIHSLFDTLVAAIGPRLRLALAGDYHHYRRHEHPNGRQYITCGTGGAFLHPTHNMNDDVVESGAVLRKCIPDPETSSNQTYWNILFLFWNWSFAFVPALAYSLVAWTTGKNIGEHYGLTGRQQIAELGTIGLWEFPKAFYVALHSAFLSPGGMFLYLLIFLGFWYFTQSDSRFFRFAAGTLHTLAHIIVGFLIFWLASYASITWAQLEPKDINQYLLATAIIVLLSIPAGSAIMGLYLLISLNRFGQHFTEAFSSLKIEDWKGFLRMRIRADGTLEAYFIGIDRVPRKWKEKEPDAAGPRWLPDDKRAAAFEVKDIVRVT